MLFLRALFAATQQPQAQRRQQGKRSGFGDNRQLCEIHFHHGVVRKDLPERESEPGQSGEIVDTLRVEVDAKLDRPYWRGVDYDLFDGQRWRRSRVW